METLRGIIEVRRQNIGSRSEGNFTFLKTEDGRKFTLYRSEIIPQGDAFLQSFDGQTIDVDGDAEPNGYFRVSALRLADGTPQAFPQKEIPHVPDFDFSPVNPVAGKTEDPPRTRKKTRSFFIKKGRKRSSRR